MTIPNLFLDMLVTATLSVSSPALPVKNEMPAEPADDRTKEFLLHKDYVARLKDEFDAINLMNGGLEPDGRFVGANAYSGIRASPSPKQRPLYSRGSEHNI